MCIRDRAHAGPVHAGGRVTACGGAPNGCIRHSTAPSTIGVRWWGRGRGSAFVCCLARGADARMLTLGPYDRMRRSEPPSLCECRMALLGCCARAHT
eukprot:6589179-Prymnesium_polylepis.2